MQFFLTPEIAARLLIAVVTILMLGYLASKRDKSPEIRLLLWTIGVLVFFVTLNAGYEVLHTHPLTSGPGIANVPLVAVAVWITLVVYTNFLVAVVYRTGFWFSKIESYIVLAIAGLVTLGLAALQLLSTGDVARQVAEIRIITPTLLWFHAWLCFVCLRKLAAAFRRKEDPQSVRVTGLVFSVVLLSFLWIYITSVTGVVIALSATLRGILPNILVVTVISILFVVILLYGKDRHSVLVKLTGLMAVVLITLSTILFPLLRPHVSLRQEFLDPGDWTALEFRPDSLGAYVMSEITPDWIEPEGEHFSLGDDSEILHPSKFPFPFYGAEYDSIWSGTNGSMSFGAPIEADQIFSEGESFYDGVPSAMILYSDQIMGGRGSEIVIDATEEQYVVTWIGISEYNLMEATSTFQTVLTPDGVIRFNYAELGVIPLLHYVGISPGGPAEPVSFSSGRIHGEPDAAIFTHLDARDAFRIYMHPLLVPPFVAALGSVLLFLLLGAVFYRVGLLVHLEKLLTGLRAVEGGDLDTELRITERNELGELGDHFNSMIASLRTYTREMEGLVSERTADLDQTVKNLRATQKQLVEQEKLASLGALTAGIAHEIKNPLNFVNNFAEIGGELADELAEAVSGGDQNAVQSALDAIRQNADQIAKHGRRADSIVKSMMQHARGGTSDKESVDINAFVDEYAGLAWHGMRARDHNFKADIEKHLSDDVGSLDVLPQELGRVILNLLNNAFDAVKLTDSPVVTVATALKNGHIQITVSDNGPGIAAEIRDKIFEPFFTTKATGEGTGLGLSLSYDIITKGHGGTMLVQESPKGGAEFVIKIPESV